MPGKSRRVRLSEVRAVFRLVGECRDLGADQVAWRGHVARSLGGLTGSQVVLSCETARSADGVTPGRIYHAEDHGWPSARSREIWASYIEKGDYLREPLFRAIQSRASRRGLCARDQVVDDPTWFGSPFYNETQRVCEIDEILVSFEDLPGRERQDFLSVYRPRGGKVFGPRERRLVRLLHGELGRHFGAALATLNDPGPAGLPPSRRRALRCLLEGDSEKQVAARLGLSTLTVHGYVKDVYRHFRVSSRPELLAYFLRRSGLRLRGPDDPA